MCTEKLSLCCKLLESLILNHLARIDSSPFHCFKCPMQQHIIQKKTYAEHKLNEEKVVVKKHVQLPPPNHNYCDITVNYLCIKWNSLPCCEAHLHSLISNYWSHFKIKYLYPEVEATRTESLVSLNKPAVPNPTLGTENRIYMCIELYNLY